MALSAAVVWEIRTTGNNNNGGGFKAGASGIDRSQQALSHANLTTLSVVNATTTKITVSLTDYTVTLNDIGNVYNNTGGTSTAGFYEITGADTAANTWTLDRAIGTAAQTVTGSMGGALAAPGLAAGVATIGNTIYLKSGTYPASGVTNVAGGPITSWGNGTATTISKIIGYDNVRNDNGIRPIIQATGSGLSLIDIEHDFFRVSNVTVHGNGQTTINGIHTGIGANRIWLVRCMASGCDTEGIRANSGAASTRHHWILCEATNCTKPFMMEVTGELIYCNSHHNADDAFFVSGTDCKVTRCIANTASGTNHMGYNITGPDTLLEQCVSYNTTGNGFLMAENCTAINCVAEGATVAGKFGLSGPPTDNTVSLFNCAGFNNNTNVTLIGENEGFITLTGSPFTNAAADDFSLNNTTGAGALLRAAGFGSGWLGNSTTNFLDVGVSQSVLTTGGSTVADTVEKYSNQKVFQGASGNWIEFSLKHSGGNTVAGIGANILVGYVSPRDKTLQTISSPTITELPIAQASGHYLLQPTAAMIGEQGTIKIMASGAGTALGQSGRVLSELTTIFVDVESNEFDENVPEAITSFVTGTPHFGYFVGGALGSGTALRII